MSHSETQLRVEVELYDIVSARIYFKPVAGRMNSFNRTVEHKDFTGFGLVVGKSDSFCLIYLPNRESKLFQIKNLVVASKFNNNVSKIKI